MINDNKQPICKRCGNQREIGIAEAVNGNEITQPCPECCEKIVLNKQPDIKCLICCHPVQAVEHVIFDKKTKAQAATETYFHCKNETCKTVVIIPLPEAEALARFQQRPESVEAKAFKKIEAIVNDIYSYGYGWGGDIIFDKYEKIATIMQQIEKDLKK